MPRKGFMFGKRKRHMKPRGSYAKKLKESIESPTNSEEGHSLELEENVMENDTENNTSTASAAARKHSIFPLSFSGSDDPSYTIVSNKFLLSLISSVNCSNPNCLKQTLTLTTSSKKGLAEFCTVTCTSCDKKISSSWTSEKSNSGFDINVRSVLVLKECGISYSKFSKFCGLMSLPKYLDNKAFVKVEKKVHTAVIEASEEAMNKSAAVVYERAKTHPAQQGRVSATGCPVITVSFDGTWHKRGHSSHTGIGTVIDFETGLVLDTQVLSNYCKGCATKRKANSMPLNARHQAACQKNFDGSANAMEAEAASLIFSRSVMKRKLIYGTMLCDGDSKSFAAAKNSCEYDVGIIKEDCINHISKRMFNALETLKASNKKELNYKLTRPNIEEMTNYYATNLRKNAPDVLKMKMSVMGSFFHMMSTDKEPNHRLCPDGPNSWCHFKKAQALNEKQRPHTPTFTAEVGKLVFPIVKRLTEPELLERCAKMGTQNANESFHATIWKRCPKTEFASMRSVETSTHLAILSFNLGPFGIKSVFDHLGLQWTVRNNKSSETTQTLKLKNADRRAQRLSKWKRKNLKKRRNAIDNNRKIREGTSYDPGHFNT